MTLNALLNKNFWRQISEVITRRSTSARGFYFSRTSYWCSGQMLFCWQYKISGGWLKIGRAVHLLFQRFMELMITLLTCFPVNPTGLTDCDDNLWDKAMRTKKNYHVGETVFCQFWWFFSISLCYPSLQKLLQAVSAFLLMIACAWVIDRKYCNILISLTLC